VLSILFDFIDHIGSALTTGVYDTEYNFKLDIYTLINAAKDGHVSTDRTSLLLPSARWMAGTSVNTRKITHFNLTSIQASMARPLLHEKFLIEASHICHTRTRMTILHGHSITVRASHLTTHPFLPSRWVAYGGGVDLRQSLILRI
jgi:hypothetical protein